MAMAGSNQLKKRQEPELNVGAPRLSITLPRRNNTQSTQNTTSTQTANTGSSAQQTRNRIGQGIYNAINKGSKWLNDAANNVRQSSGSNTTQRTGTNNLASRSTNRGSSAGSSSLPSLSKNPVNLQQNINSRNPGAQYSGNGGKRFEMAAPKEEVKAKPAPEPTLSGATNAGGRNVEQTSITGSRTPGRDNSTGSTTITGSRTQTSRPSAADNYVTSIKAMRTGTEDRASAAAAEGRKQSQAAAASAAKAARQQTGAAATAQARAAAAAEAKKRRGK